MSCENESCMERINFVPFCAVCDAVKLLHAVSTNRVVNRTLTPFKHKCIELELKSYVSTPLIDVGL